MCPGVAVAALVAPVELKRAALERLAARDCAPGCCALGACFIGAVLSVTVGAVCAGAGGSTDARALLVLDVVPAVALPPHPASAIAVASRAVVPSGWLLPRGACIVTRLR